MTRLHRSIRHACNDLLGSLLLAVLLVLFAVGTGVTIQYLTTLIP